MGSSYAVPSSLKSAESVGSSIHSCHPAGTGPHAGSGRQVGVGFQPLGGLGQFGGGLKISAMRSLPSARATPIPGSDGAHNLNKRNTVTIELCHIYR